MKKTLFLAAVLAFAVQSQAQTTTTTQAYLAPQPTTVPSKALGVNLLFGSLNNNLGVGVKYQQYVDNHVRLEGSLGYYFPHNHMNAWDLNLNAHYVFRLNPKWAIYPLAGFSFVIAGQGEETKSGNTIYAYNHLSLGANFGGGVQYFLSNNLFVNGEVRQQVLSGNFSQANISVGLGAKF